MQSALQHTTIASWQARCNTDRAKNGHCPGHETCKINTFLAAAMTSVSKEDAGVSQSYHWVLTCRCTLQRTSVRMVW